MKKLIVFLFFIFHYSFFISIPAQTVVHYSFDPAVQHFNVPPGVNTITVTIAGAKGAGALGGKGASFTGICNVISPHILSVAVGQEGTTLPDTNSWIWGGGGGGASWVYDSNVVLYNPLGNTGLIAVAAAGGGAGSYAFYSVPFQGWQYYAGGDGGIDLTTNAATVGTYSDSGGKGGNGGDNGGDTQFFIFTASGAGWLSNGIGGGVCYSGMDEANHFRNLAIGCNIHGAFGGGGGSRKYNEAGNDGTNGGGGAGYNGGGAGLGGGGGGSYLNGTLVGVATASDTGNGFVTISYIPPLTQVIDIYPNPNSGLFTINGVRQEQMIEIYNCLGQKIISTQAVNTFIQLNLSVYANGVYIVIVHNTDGSKVWQTKVVKMQ